MKKLLIILAVFISFFILSESTTFAACDPTSGNIGNALGDCLNAEKIVGGSSNGFNKTIKIEGGFKTMINNWIKNISAVLFLITVFALVYAGLMMTLSAGEDEKIKKAKDIIKWTLIGFLGLISAGTIITIIINIFYKF